MKNSIIIIADDITLKFHDGELLVEEARLREIPFFKSLKCFEDAQSCNVDVLQVADLSKVMIERVLDETYFDDHFELFNYLGIVPKHKQMCYFGNVGKLVRLNLIFNHATYDEFADVKNYMQIQYMHFGRKTYYFNVDMTTMYVWGEAPTCDLAYDILKIYEYLCVDKMAMSYEKRRNCNVEGMQERIKELVKIGDVSNFADFFEDFLGGEYDLTGRSANFKVAKCDFNWEKNQRRRQIKRVYKNKMGRLHIWLFYIEHLKLNNFIFYNDHFEIPRWLITS